ncbi:hypothetical protein CLV62_11924 [Dysgonomonas alginatilytica]|uniref:Uncharacterized protein n=1 Tax=Dysgonomonas alginatilytica TaxID=1605892 RepID=A0A2V3PP20_9BACT|nr:hypothetical protein CLV62_11924 [Dysgonomonas alginatilytica]
MMILCSEAIIAFYFNHKELKVFTKPADISLINYLLMFLVVVGFTSIRF